MRLKVQALMVFRDSTLRPVCLYGKFLYFLKTAAVCLYIYKNIDHLYFEFLRDEYNEYKTISIK